MIPSTRKAIFGLAAIAVLGALVYFLAPLRPETPGTVSIPDRAGQATSSRANVERSPAAAIKPRTLAESEPAEGTASSRGSLEIEVIGPKGAPASNARLVLTRGTDVLGAATTDERGVASLRAGEGEAGILIVPDRAPRYETTISIAPGRRRIELPAGVSISGRVEVEGAPPKEAVRLWADTQDPPFGVRSDAVWEALKQDSRPALTTQPSGAFEIDGLKPGSDWKFGVHSIGYRLEEIAVDGRAVFAVTAPSDGVVMKLSRLPVVRGRVVSGADHAPVARAIMSVSLTGELSGMTRYQSAHDDGRFEFPAANEFDRTMTIKRVTIEITGPTRAGQKTVMLDPAPDRDLDLGDVEIPAASKLRFEVRDPSGTPIAGALARIGDADVDPETRTDAHGIGTVLVPPEAKILTFGALKHEVREVPVPDPLPELLRVVLQPAAGLEIVILSKEGTPASSVRARIKCKAPGVWSTESGYGNPISVAAGATAASFGHGGDDAESNFSPSSDGRVVVSGLHSGIPLTVAALDELDHELASVSVTLGIGEWRTIELRLTETPRVLKGRVRDAAGVPIGDARVIVGKDEYVGSRCHGFANVAPRIATTDATGRFVLAGLYEGAKNLAVDKRGYVTLIRKHFTWPAADTELEFTLETGFTLTVRVVEADGTPIRDLGISVTTPGLPEWCQDNKAPGIYAFTDFPKGAVATISTLWATKTWTRTVPVRSDVTETITMPATGKIEIDYGSIEGDAFLLSLRATDIAQDSRPHWLFEAAASGFPRAYLAQPVFAGNYEAAIRRVRPRDDGSLAAPLVPVTVRASETTRIVFRKP